METLNKVIFSTKGELLGKEASASLSLDPLLRWIKFTLVDDKPNENGDTIQQDEFPNLIRTGINKPFKMAENAINPGHKGAEPLGVITNLTQENNTVVGLAALWEAEREEDVTMLKEMFAEGKDLTISWELFCRAEEAVSEGIRNLKGVILRAATLVGIPAYGDRTKILAFASKNNPLEGNNMTLEEAMAKIAELQAKVTELETELQTQENDASTLKQEKASIQETLTSLTIERDELASYKQTIEAESAKNAKVSAIKAKFTEAGITKDESYFDTNIEKLLSMNDNQLDFMVSELAHFTPVQASVNTIVIPNVTSEKKNYSPKELASELRELNKR